MWYSMIDIDEDRRVTIECKRDTAVMAQELELERERFERDYARMSSHMSLLIEERIQKSVVSQNLDTIKVGRSQKPVAKSSRINWSRKEQEDLLRLENRLDCHLARPLPLRLHNQTPSYR